jgi:hypothetical protein
MTTTVIVNVGTLTTEISALIDRIMSRPQEVPATLEATFAPCLPPVPGARDGERYAGIAFDESGQPSHHLFLLDAKPEEDLDWQAAKAWAKSIDASLPTRFEAALLYANLRGQFDTDRWHWTDTQYSADNAWCQHFSYGNQDVNGKDDTLLARAVRRLPL